MSNASTSLAAQLARLGGGMGGLIRDPRLDRRAQSGAELVAAAGSTAPVGSLVEGLARAGQGLVGGYIVNRADRERGERGRSLAELLMEAQNVPQAERMSFIMGSGNEDAAALMAPALVQGAMPPAPTELKLDTVNGQRVAVNPITGEIVRTLGSAIEAPEGMMPDGQGGFAPIPGYVDMRSQIAQAGASRNNTTVQLPAEDSFLRGLGGNTAQGLAEARNAANSASSVINASGRILDLLDRGVITGFGAEGRLAFEQAMTALGVMDGQRVTNTEQLLAEIANNVLAKTEQMKGVLTDRDIEFLRDAAAGRISLTQDTIRRTAEIADRGGRSLIQNYNDLVTPLQNEQRIPEVTRRMYSPLAAPPPRQPRQTATTAAPASGVTGNGAGRGASELSDDELMRQLGLR